MRLFCLTLFLILFFIHSGKVYAQDNNDTLPSKPPVKKDHRPRNAAIRSAIIPGWGQVYNGKWWKVPILYAGAAVDIGFLISNHKNFKFYQDTVNLITSKNPNDVNLQLYRNNRDQFRNWRDWNIVILIGIYALNIVDANVDAHLREFDVGENLSFGIKPYLCPDQLNSRLVTGLSLNINFKK